MRAHFIFDGMLLLLRLLLFELLHKLLGLVLDRLLNGSAHGIVERFQRVIHGRAILLLRLLQSLFALRFSLFPRQFRFGDARLLLKIALQLIELCLDFLLHLPFHAPLRTLRHIIRIGKRRHDIPLQLIGKGVRQRFDLRVDVGKVTACPHSSDTLFHVFCDHFIDLIAEQILRFADDDLVRHFRLTVRIDVDLVHIVERLTVALAALLLRGNQFFHNIPHDARRAEDIADILKEEIGHKAAAHDFLALEFAGDGEHLRCIQLHHLALVVLAENGEEVQKPLNIFFSVLRCTAPVHRTFGEIVCEIVEDDQRSCGIEVEHIRRLFAETLTFTRQNAGVLRAERRLHIRRRAFQIAEHEHAAPFGNGDADSQLPDGKRDRLIVFGNGFLHAVEGFARHFVVIFFATITCSDNDLVF